MSTRAHPALPPSRRTHLAGHPRPCRASYYSPRATLRAYVSEHSATCCVRRNSADAVAMGEAAHPAQQSRRRARAWFKIDPAVSVALRDTGALPRHDDVLHIAALVARAVPVRCPLRRRANRAARSFDGAWLRAPGSTATRTRFTQARAALSSGHAQRAPHAQCHRPARQRQRQPAF